MDYKTRVSNLQKEYKEETGYHNPIPIAWSINFFIEWEKTVTAVKEGARKRGIDLNFIEIVSR